MVNVSIQDNQKVLIHAKPWTASSPGRPASAFAFQVAAVNDTTNILDLLVTAGAPASDPTFTARSKSSFFGPDRVITLNLSGVDSAPGAVRKTTQMTVTVQGTQPDDGTLDHFEPVGDPPVAQ